SAEDAPWRCSWVVMISRRNWRNVKAISIGCQRAGSRRSARELAIASARELTPFAERLAHRIASFPAHAIAHAKTAVDIGAFGSMAEALLVEARESDLSVASEVTQARVAEALKVGAETREGELEMEFLSKLSPTRTTRVA